MTRNRLAGRIALPVAVVLTAAAGLVGLAAGPATAAQCSGAGVNVVVDFNGLGGGVQKGCDPKGANRKASEVFVAAGFPLSYARRQPGFVCRVKNAPTSDPCVNASPADAYWGLYWSDGKSGSWKYSSTGVSGLKVPSGGFVAFSWQGSSTKSPPSATPRNSQAPKPAPKPTPKPQPKPQPKPTKKPQPQPQPTKAQSRPTKAPGSGEGAGTGKPDPVPAGSGASRAPRPDGTASESESPRSRKTQSPEPSDGASEPGSVVTLEPSPDAGSGAADAAETVDGQFSSAADDGGLPTWVPVAVVLALVAAAGGVVARRRRGASG